MKINKITVLIFLFLYTPIALCSQEHSKCISNPKQKSSAQYTGIDSGKMPSLLVNSGLFLKTVYNGVVRFYSDRYKECEQVKLLNLDHGRKLTNIEIDLQRYRAAEIFRRVDENSILFLDNEKKKKEYEEVHEKIDKDLAQIHKEQMSSFITLFTCFCSTALPVVVISYLVLR
jgi:hypothetical protein